MRFTEKILMNDACFRRIQTLRLLPKAPARKSVTQLLDEIAAQGFEIDRRSLQRDLKSLSGLFPIENDGNKDIPGWFWRKDAEKLELPEMEPTVALSFRMVKLFLERFMPPSTLNELQSYFGYSDKILNNLSHNHLSDWSDKVALLSRSQPFLSPQIDPVILNTVYEALLSDKQIRAHYHPLDQDPRDYTVNALGLVVIDKIIYLVGTLWEYTDIKQFALHRFMNIEILEDNCIEIKGFNLQQYIQDGHFEYLANKDESTIELKLKASNWLVRQLDENPLSINQEIHFNDGGNIVIATVKNTHQLRWWLMGLGEDVEILEPLNLRKEFAQSFKNLHKRYQ